jgi:hypothetical protein
MPATPSHCEWFEDTDTVLQTSDGKSIRVVRFNHIEDAAVLTEWAFHFRKHYCSDEDLDANATAMGMTRAEYLRDIKFPGPTAPGPSIKSGDFSEILVADYIQYLLGYVVPRTRYDRKDTRDTSSKAVDVIGFKYLEPTQSSPDDELITCEVKGALTAPANNSMQHAIDGSKLDFAVRLPLALNAAYQRLRDREDLETANALERFMNRTVRPYKNISSAAFMCCDAGWRPELATDADATHPNPNFQMIVFLGPDLMTLANRLYEHAYATA